MQRLWAPWRVKYIRSNKKNKRCIFCAAKKPGKRHYVIFKTRYSICMLNAFPYNSGHLMVSPLRHIGDIVHLKEVEAMDLFRSLQKARRLLDKVLKPQGYNIGINISKIAGSGIPGHLHLHIVPRWQGDTNFMPVLSELRVISQSLDALHKKLKYAQSTAD